ncbi:Oidioi.mRNA.OKI2018_I69.XSR.g16807.t2.cds [Oikopleura dioica]|uniref:Oidioi.mRNA.OKI2018_I69.XSR.g16807.t2.cds n=1 Tax=Oikopleura dioica TaxID=34765 RepID=A0ABN7SHA5_OIKDI|nr:Oidioi.mRNA.OKI2018_I69.XSR.g16807.t2.cds [Oikopleura dioica]
MRLFPAIFVAFAAAYPYANIACNGNRRYSCRFCGESCGQEKCPEPFKLEDFAHPDDFPDCTWGCYCEEGTVWSPDHETCVDGTWDEFCPKYYPVHFIPKLG